MKKHLGIVVTAIAVAVLAAASGCGADSSASRQSAGTGSAAQAAGSVAQSKANDGTLGDYSVEIKSCRLATDMTGKDIVIVTYGFTNNGDDDAAFYVSLKAEVFQGGIGLNNSYMVDDSTGYSADNQTKSIKPGATLEVEEAYELNDTTSDLEVEVSEFISFSDKKLTKTFTIAK